MLTESPRGFKTQMNDSELFGMVGGMMDGLIEAFEYRGITVRNNGASMGVSVDGTPEGVVGGRLLMESTSLEGAVEWLDAKADYYGDN